MKHLAQALAILNKAEFSLEGDYNDAKAAALRRVDEEFAFALRALRDAKTAIQKRFASHEAIMEDYFGELKTDTPKDTNARIRRSHRRERSAKDLRRKVAR